MPPPAGARRKVWAVFVLQLAAISCAALVGVYGAAAILEDQLIRRALRDEAQHFFQRAGEQPGLMPPDTYNMRGYLVGRDAAATPLPDELLPFGPGFHRLRRAGIDELVYVSDGEPGRLFLVFRREQVHRLAFLFGFVPLTAVLLIIYLATWLTYRASRRARSPVVALANIVRDWDPKSPDLGALNLEHLPGETDRDVRVLAGALHRFAARIESFVERERNFTRDASHELRSPLTVIKVAADVLEDEELTAFARRAVGRIRTATRDMEALIEAFLILARESDTGLPQEDFEIDALVDEEAERVRPLLDNKPVQLFLRHEGRFSLHASPRVLSVMLGNLLRNACHYTEEGRVVITVGADYVRVQDTGVGMSDDDLAHVFTPFFHADRNPRGGHGVGLTIVKRLSDRFGWPLELTSVLGKGTTATIRFPQARALAVGGGRGSDAAPPAR